jgi:hypothetical protein
MWERLRRADLGLSYEAAAHGVQTAIKFDMDQGGKATEPKHMRTGIDMSKSDQMALVSLLIDKGLFTLQEYEEYLRLAANSELHTRERETGGGMYFR